MVRLTLHRADLHRRGEAASGRPGWAPQAGLYLNDSHHRTAVRRTTSIRSPRGTAVSSRAGRSSVGGRIPIRPAASVGRIRYATTRTIHPLCHASPVPGEMGFHQRSPPDAYARSCRRTGGAAVHRRSDRQVALLCTRSHLGCRRHLHQATGADIEDVAVNGDTRRHQGVVANASHIFDHAVGLVGDGQPVDIVALV